MNKKKFIKKSILKKSLINLSLEFDNTLIWARLRLPNKTKVGLKRLRRYVLTHQKEHKYENR